MNERTATLPMDHGSVTIVVRSGEELLSQIFRLATSLTNSKVLPQLDLLAEKYGEDGSSECSRTYELIVGVMEDVEVKFDVEIDRAVDEAVLDSLCGDLVIPTLFATISHTILERRLANAMELSGYAEREEQDMGDLFSDFFGRASRGRDL